MIDIEQLHLQYLINDEGEKTSVMMPIEAFNRLMYDFKFLRADVEGKKALLKAEIETIDDERILKFIHQFIVLLKQGEVITVDAYFKKYWDNAWIET